MLGFSVSNTGSLGGIQWLGRYSNKRAGNYQNALDGKVYNSGFEESDGNLFLGISKNWGYTNFYASMYQNTLNLIEGERDSMGKFTYTDLIGDVLTATEKMLNTYSIGTPHQQIQHFSVSTSNYFILKKGNIHLDLGFQNNLRKEFGDAAAPDAFGLFFDLRTLNYAARYSLAMQNAWETTVGVGGMAQGHENRGTEFLIPNYHLFDIGGFATTQKALRPNLTFSAGMRFDHRSVDSKQLTSKGETKFEAFQKNYSGLSGSVGLSYQMDAKSTLKVNLSQGYRAPNIAEIGANGRHEGTFRYEIGNPNLRAEQSRQLDVAYFYQIDHLHIEFTPFVNAINNYIFAQKIMATDGGDSIPDPTDPAPAFRFAQGNAILWGGEVVVDIHPHWLDWLHIENTFSFVQATQIGQADSSRYLPFTPAPRYRGELKAEIGHLPSFMSRFLTNTYAKIGVDYFFAQNNIYAAYQTETSTPAYGLVGIGIGTMVVTKNKKPLLNLSVNVDNLMNTAYQNHLSRLKYAPENPVTGNIGVFNMGRNVSIKAVWHF